MEKIIKTDCKISLKDLREFVAKKGKNRMCFINDELDVYFYDRLDFNEKHVILSSSNIQDKSCYKIPRSDIEYFWIESIDDKIIDGTIDISIGIEPFLGSLHIAFM